MSLHTIIAATTFSSNGKPFGQLIDDGATVIFCRPRYALKAAEIIGHGGMVTASLDTRGNVVDVSRVLDATPVPVTRVS